MPVRLEDKNREYKRFRHTPFEKLYLQNRGFIWVNSSNVSAVSRVRNDLYIRFHNGSIYKYFGQGDKLEELLASNSKGEWVWNNLRRKNVKYKKIGRLPFPEDDKRDDRDLFKDIDKKFNRVAAIIGSELLGNFIDKATGLQMQKFLVGNLVINKIVPT